MSNNSVNSKTIKLTPSRSIGAGLTRTNLGVVGTVRSNSGAASLTTPSRVSTITRRPSQERYQSAYSRLGGLRNSSAPNIAALGGDSSLTSPVDRSGSSSSDTGGSRLLSSRYSGGVSSGVSRNLNLGYMRDRYGRGVTKPDDDVLAKTEATDSDTGTPNNVTVTVISDRKHGVGVDRAESLKEDYLSFRAGGRSETQLSSTKLAGTQLSGSLEEVKGPGRRNQSSVSTPRCIDNPKPLSPDLGYYSPRSDLETASQHDASANALDESPIPGSGIQNKQKHVFKAQKELTFSPTKSDYSYSSSSRICKDTPSAATKPQRNGAIASSFIVTGVHMGNQAVRQDDEYEVTATNAKDKDDKTETALLSSTVARAPGLSTPGTETEVETLRLDSDTPVANTVLNSLMMPSKTQVPESNGPVSGNTPVSNTPSGPPRISGTTPVGNSIAPGTPGLSGSNKVLDSPRATGETPSPMIGRFAKDTLVADKVVDKTPDTVKVVANNTPDAVKVVDNAPAAVKFAANTPEADNKLAANTPEAAVKVAVDDTPVAMPRTKRKMAKRSISFKKVEEDEYIGFSSLPEQVHRKAVRRGFEFTLMVVGETGLGKSTLINSLFLTDLYKDRKVGNTDERVHKTVDLEKKELEIEERGVKLKLTIVDTPGFNDAVNAEESWKPIVNYIDKQFETYFKAESGLNRKNIVDTRVHCCLYFISPYGHGLRPVDVSVMKRLHHKVNIVPLIAKADMLTKREVKALKEKVLQEIERHKIQIYQFPDCDSDEDEDFKQQDSALKKSIPFAVVGSNTVVEAGGKKIRGRMYPWGIVEVENPQHCDFVKLRQMLISTHMQDLKDVTCDIHYENYRAEHIAEEMTTHQRERNKLKRDSTPNLDKALDTEKLLQEKEMEIKRMQEMLAKMQAQLGNKNGPQVNGRVTST